MRLSATMKGDKELLAQLTQLKGDMVGQALVNALLAGAQPIQDEWQIIAPYKTGQYRRSIHTEVIKATGSNAFVAIGTSITEPPYPLYLEYGTAPRFATTVTPYGKRRVRRQVHPGMRPRPSARPAYDEKKAEALAIIKDKFRQQIIRIARSRLV